ncbi:MAG: DNA double-strand break repair nuclease NurA [Chloroflexi bacterium]|nr:DNA double-strand break repair nuclease NurA [Chloroflexota bacterium]
MTLDLGQLGAQIRALGAHLAGDQDRYQERLAEARALLAAASAAELTAAGEGGAALPREEPRHRAPCPPLPAVYTALAADGSQIEPDRHAPALWYLLNIGAAAIEYGDAPRAVLTSTPTLYYRREDLYLTQGSREAPIEGNRLEQKRHVAEMVRLAELATEARQRRAPGPVALADGQLLLWNHRVEDFVRDQFLAEFQRALQQFIAAEVPVAGYISRSRAADVLDLLRRLPAHYEACPRCAGMAPQQPCTLGGLHDRALFADLAEGERSALFESRVLADRYPADLRPWFCYLNVGREIVRLEILAWAAERAELRARLHAVVVAQCRLGHGYPVVLARAHEQAVVTAGDRRRVNELVARALAAQGLSGQPSAKQAAKLVRAV